VATFNGSAEGLFNPNDVYAVPITDTTPDSESVFFATNDHYFRNFKPGRFAEMGLRLPTSSVLYHSVETGFQRVIKNMVGANGIAGSRMLNTGSKQDNKLYIASIFAGQIHIYNFPASPKAVKSKEGFKFLHKVQTDFVMDNLAIDADENWLYMAGHGQPYFLFQHFEEPEKVSSPSVSYRLSLKDLNGKFYGSHGEIGEVRIQKVLLDKMVRHP